MATQDYPTGPIGRRPLHDLWLRELPYLAILLLAVCGAAYVSMTRSAIVHYWDVVAVFVALVGIVVGWRGAADRHARWRAVWTQVLHWAAFLLAMNLVFLPSIQSILNADATSLTVLLLLALGTFVAGVHMAAPLMCANGLVMALIVPAVAWLDQSALLIALVLVALAGIAAAVLWIRRQRG
jgi:hypothetical protein